MKQNKKKVCIVPIGDIPEILLKVICAHIDVVFKLTAEIIPPLEYPAYARDEERCQYNAAIILETLRNKKISGFEKILAVCDVDLFVPILTYVFGESQQGGTCALISLFRLKNQPDGIYERAVKIALHELGHLFDLHHCERGKCLMHFAGGIKTLDHIPLNFCRYCDPKF